AASRTYRDGTFACSCEWLRAIGPGPAIRPSVRRHCWEERTYLRCFAIWLRGADWSTGCLMDPSRGGRSFGSTSFLSYTTKRGGELGIPCVDGNSPITLHQRPSEVAGFHRPHTLAPSKFSGSAIVIQKGAQPRASHSPTFSHDDLAK